MYFSVLGAIITIVFNLLMIPKIGFMASAWATLITYGFMMMISFFIGQKHYPVPYQLKKVSFYVLFATVLCWVSFSLFRGNVWFSVSTIFSYFGLVFLLEKSTIKQIMKR